MAIPREKLTLLEAGFPYTAVSRLVAADRRSPDHAYQAHRWWARRPPALIRAGLLAAALPAQTSPAKFWSEYRSEAPALHGYRIFDPFAGGGTTLVEASRLGAHAWGQDVDPMAVELNRHQLSPPLAADVRTAGERLVTALESEIGDLWPARLDDGTVWSPLHYFSVAEVTCPACNKTGLAYRNLVVARSIGNLGAVVRDDAVNAFCPTCHRVQGLAANQSALSCCKQRHPLEQGTLHVGRYRCSCGAVSTQDALLTGVAPRIVVAIEETQPGGRRRIRSATGEDLVSAKRVGRTSLDEPLSVTNADPRPVSFGILTSRDLYTSRQLAYLDTAFRWIDEELPDDEVARALRLAVSTSIVSNNRLCGYATDYGRLAPLFSVRAFSMPALAVEMNPLNPIGGRGSLRATISRVAESCETAVRRHVIGPHGPEPQLMDLPRTGAHIELADSAAQTQADTPFDLCFTDPPYFDFVPYDTLSQVFRAWLPTDRNLAGTPVLPSAENPIAGFTGLLSTVFTRSREVLDPPGLLAFTFKGNDAAWRSVAEALRIGGFGVTALWPVLADPGMGHHSGANNCEFDLLVVARAREFCQPSSASFPVADWIRELSKVRNVSAADQESFRRAADTLAPLRCQAG